MFETEYRGSNITGMNKIIGIRPIKKNIPTVPEIDKIPEDNAVEADLLLKEAEQRLIEARKEAGRLLDETRLVIESEQKQWQEREKELEKQAWEKGLQAGLEHGREQGFQEYSDLIQQAAKTIDQAKNEYQEILSESEEVILHIALSAAAKILHAEVERTDHYAELVKYVLSEVKEQPKISVYAHPDDYNLLLTQKEELLNIIRFKADFSLYPDSNLKKGSCMVESPYGLIDAGVDSQLLELRNKLFELSKEKASENG